MQVSPYASESRGALARREVIEHALWGMLGFSRVGQSTFGWQCIFYFPAFATACWSRPMSEPVLYSLRGQAAWITLNAPANHNALSQPLCEGLLAALTRAESDPAVRLIVLAAEGRTFCAGADLKRAGGGAVQGEHKEPPFVQVLKALWNSSRPVIARVQGPAYGGGLGLIAACDFPIMNESAKFAFTEVRLGLAPAIISVPVMRKMSLPNATRYFLTGSRFSAQEACQMGLGYLAVSEDGLDAAVDALCEEMRACGPLALGEVRTLLRTVPQMNVNDGFVWALAQSRRLFDAPEGREGMAAFAEKRPPSWMQ